MEEGINEGQKLIKSVNKDVLEKINKEKAVYFKRLTGKSPKSIKKNTGNTQNNIRNKRETITTDSTEIKN